ncbi:HAMP domain-containing histidine kinase [Fibrella sp. HMF5335]|uniref:histidine kinase n=1 Tax=Fibrella rubiginis TaxID=2817060 RepID=A0A939GK54_9BACT|nr:HAMP domain-containing sensor histidine kinase [Fibrella rubiginis]MBO0937923.1 HAMP domain-containing histidine kinase [Fibrella rubiginis]
MPNEPISMGIQLSQLATFLFSRREAILTNWRTICENDPSLFGVAGLTREEFTDQIPALLSVVERRLRQEPDATSPHQIAREHGRHRWHKGYALHELLHELSHLHETLLGELRTFWGKYVDVSPDVLMVAYQLVGTLIHEAIGGSIARYDEFQKAEATERALNLQRVLDNVNELGRQRGAMLRVASHDLRSSFSVIQGAASLLDMPDNTEQERTEMLQILNRNFPRLAALLTELMDLARLEAGHESMQVKVFDAADLLRSLINSAQPLAAKQSVFLTGDGPANLIVTGDATKVFRIAQNLLTNALKNTVDGQVSVSWSHESQFRWILSIQDTGSGLSSAAANWLSEQLQPVAEAAAVFDEDLPIQPPTASELSGEPVPPDGEGIGLYIVKRLCELLNASLDVETHAGSGTLIRVRFPIQYAN